MSPNKVHLNTRLQARSACVCVCVCMEECVCP